MILKAALNGCVWSDLRWPNNSTAMRTTKICSVLSQFGFSTASLYTELRDMIIDSKVILGASLAHLLCLRICTVDLSVPVIYLHVSSLLFSFIFFSFHSLPLLLSHDPPSIYIPFIFPLFFPPPITLSLFLSLPRKHTYMLFLSLRLFIPLCSFFSVPARHIFIQLLSIKNGLDFTFTVCLQRENRREGGRRQRKRGGLWEIRREGRRDGKDRKGKENWGVDKGRQDGTLEEGRVMKGHEDEKTEASAISHRPQIQRWFVFAL